MCVPVMELSIFQVVLISYRTRTQVPLMMGYKASIPLVEVTSFQDISIGVSL